MQKINSLLICLLAWGLPAAAQNNETAPVKEKTSFQIAEKWLPQYDVRADVAILYGMNNTFHERFVSWKERGYTIQFMTGIAWGNLYLLCVKIPKSRYYSRNRILLLYRSLNMRTFYPVQRTGS